jgi:hypothetical protein
MNDVTAATTTRQDALAPATFSCGHCGATLVFEGLRTATCPYCASPNFVERPPSPDRPTPGFVVTFVGDAAVARRWLDRWLQGRTIFADSRIKRATVAEIRGIYLPAYLYSAVAHTDYTAEIGEHYTETETYETEDKDGNKKTETRTVTRTEYRSLAGHHVGYVTDVVVSASKGLANHELAAVEPFDLQQLRRYAPALVSGWITEEFSRSVDDCVHASRGEAVDDVGAKLRRFMPGDSYCDLHWRTSVSWESIDPVLVPVWVLALRYREDKPLLRVVINGQTGRIAGNVPLVWWKIAIAVVPVLIAAAIALYYYWRTR